MIRSEIHPSTTCVYKYPYTNNPRKQYTYLKGSLLLNGAPETRTKGLLTWRVSRFFRPMAILNLNLEYYLHWDCSYVQHWGSKMGIPCWRIRKIKVIYVNKAYRWMRAENLINNAFSVWGQWCWSLKIDLDL